MGGNKRVETYKIYLITLQLLNLLAYSWGVFVICLLLRPSLFWILFFGVFGYLLPYDIPPFRNYFKVLLSDIKIGKTDFDILSFLGFRFKEYSAGIWLMYRAIVLIFGWWGILWVPFLLNLRISDNLPFLFILFFAYPTVIIIFLLRAKKLNMWFTAKIRETTMKYGELPSCFELHNLPLLFPHYLSPLWEYWAKSYLGSFIIVASSVEPIVPLKKEQVLVGNVKEILLLNSSSGQLIAKHRLCRGRLQNVYVNDNYLLFITTGALEVLSRASFTILWKIEKERFKVIRGVSPFKRGVLISEERAKESLISLLSWETGEEIWGRKHPSVAEGIIGFEERVYIIEKEGISCLDAINGEPIWHLTGKFSSISRMECNGDALFIGETNGRLSKVSKTGREDWSVRMDGEEIFFLLPLEENILALNVGRKVSLIDREGKEIWEWSLEELFKDKEKSIKYYCAYSEATKDGVYAVYLNEVSEEGLAVLIDCNRRQVIDLAFQYGLKVASGDGDRIYLGYANGLVRAYKNPLTSSQ